STIEGQGPTAGGRILPFVLVRSAALIKVASDPDTAEAPTNPGRFRALLEATTTSTRRYLMSRKEPLQRRTVNARLTRTGSTRLDRTGSMTKLSDSSPRKFQSLPPRG